MPNSSFIQVHASSLTDPMTDFKWFHILMQNIMISDCGERGETEIEMLYVLRREQGESATLILT